MRIISIEGIDGTGKSTVLEGLKEAFKDMEGICYPSFPTDWFREEFLKLKDRYVGEELTKEVNKLHTRDKQRVYEELKDEGYEFMVSDRFEVSQKVYDGAFLGGDIGDTDLESDYVIYLHASVGDVLSRIGVRDQEDYLDYENEEVLTKMSERYEEILQRDYRGRVVTIDVGNGRSREDILEDVAREIFTYIIMKK